MIANFSGGKAIAEVSRRGVDSIHAVLPVFGDTFPERRLRNPVSRRVSRNRITTSTTGTILVIADAAEAEWIPIGADLTRARPRDSDHRDHHFTPKDPILEEEDVEGEDIILGSFPHILNDSEDNKTSSGKH